MKKLHRRLSPELAKHLRLKIKKRTKGSPDSNPIYVVTPEQDLEIQAYKKKNYKSPEKRFNKRLTKDEAEHLGIKHRTGLTYCGNMQSSLKPNQVKKLKEYREKHKTPRKIKLEDTKTFKVASSRTFDKRRKTLIFTWAQNKTPVHDNLFNGILGYASKRKAQVCVIPGRYKNPTSVFPDKVNEYWAKETVPYLYANQEKIHPYLEVLGNLKISPTNSNPLSKYKSVTGISSCIIGHPRNHFEFIPVLPSYPKKLLTCTGACTVPNYTDSGAGYAGNFHHTLGFVVVELDGDHYHIRQVTSDMDGNFYDIHLAWQNGRLIENKKGCEVFTLGDVHVYSLDKEIEEASFKLIDKLKPKYVIAHDVFDGHSLKHWNTVYQDMLLMSDEGWRVDKELEKTFNWIYNRGVNKPYTMVVDAANHNDWPDRWLDNNDLKKVIDKRTFLELSQKKSQLLHKFGDKYKGLLAHLIDEKFKGEVITVGRNDSFSIKDVEHSLHGDKGANGSRGSANQYAKLNIKITAAHTHSSRRKDGYLCAGTLNKRGSYEQGLSARSNSNITQYYDGKRQAVHYVNGKFYR